MAVGEETMSEAEAMHELAKQLWERYFKQRVSDDLLNHSLDGYKATVITNNEDGTLTVRRPFDTVSMTLRCPPALAKKAEPGDQVLVVSLGDMSNSFILCATDMEGFGSGDTGEKISLLDFSDIEELETFLVETESGASETYTVTRDEYGRIVTIEDEDGFETFVEWPEFALTPATKISYNNTGSGASATNVQAALDELFAGGGGGGGPALSDDDPVMDGATPSPGASVKASRADHRHETDSSRASAAALASHVQNTSNPHGVTAAQTGALPNTATLDDIQNGTTYAKTTAAQVALIGENADDIDAIEGKIPSAASSANQLADKAFVTDSITQGTAIFRGSFAAKAALLAVAWQTSDPDAPYYVSNNDYAVVLDDETQSGECWRYIYVTGTGWTPQYRINESPLSQAQLDALNSGATAAIIGSVADKLDKTGDGKDVTATFTAASTRANISTGEKLSVLFGKIAKWFSDLGTAAFRAATGSITSGSTDLVESGAVYTDVRTRVPNYGKGKNLFRNWYFVGGGTGRGVLPVNQRGFTTSSNVNHVWSIDGWYINGGRGTQTLNSTGFYLSNTTTSGGTTLQQWVGNENEYAGKVMTLSAIVDGVLVSGTDTIPQKTSATQSAIQIIIATGLNFTLFALPTSEPGYVAQFQATPGTSMTIQAAKLEFGTEQTLAHQENGVLVLNEIPDYEEELIRCKTYPGYTGTIPDTYDEKSLATEQQLAPVEWGTTASRAYAVGEYFCWNGLSYRVTAAISSGGSFTPGTNCKETSAAKMFTILSNTFTTNANGRVSSGLYWSQGYIVQAWSQSREVRIYSNNTNAQGFLVLDTSGNPVASTSVSITYLVYNYNL